MTSNNVFTQHNNSAMKRIYKNPPSTLILLPCAYYPSFFTPTHHHLIFPHFLLLPPQALTAYKPATWCHNNYTQYYSVAQRQRYTIPTMVYFKHHKLASSSSTLPTSPLSFPILSPDPKKREKKEKRTTHPPPHQSAPSQTSEFSSIYVSMPSTAERQTLFAPPANSPRMPCLEFVLSQAVAARTRSYPILWQDVSSIQSGSVRFS